MKAICVITAACSLALISLTGCTTGAREGAAQGAAYGMIGGMAACSLSIGSTSKVLPSNSNSRVAWRNNWIFINDAPL